MAQCVRVLTPEGDHFSSIMSIHESHAFVLEQARLNIMFVKASPGHVAQAKQVNSALATMVASERNMVMHRALERALRNDDEDVQGLSEPPSGAAGTEVFPQPVPHLLECQPAQAEGGTAGGGAGTQPEELPEARGKAQRGKRRQKP